MSDENLDTVQTSTARRYRYFVDIVVLIAVVFGLEIAVQATYRPKTIEGGYALDLIVRMLEIVIAWGLIRFRGETLADIGIKQPRSWLRTIPLGIAISAVVFAAIYLSEKAGFHRDLSSFAALQGNLRITLIMVVYVLIGAGFYEEFMFRGFLMQGFAMFFGGSRAAWAIALIVQAALFGLAHAYQNPLGVLITGTLGALLGVVVLVSGRNLWIAIIAHGLFDASRSVLFYFTGPPHS
jgi:membrane protease YdiL (CAAX protease family)